MDSELTPPSGAVVALCGSGAGYKISDLLTYNPLLFVE